MADNPLPAAWFLGAGALVLYLVTLAHGVAWDDSAELAAGVARLGIVHPTGYPPYVLFGHVFTLIEPIGGDATRANAWSALCAAAAVALSARYVLRHGGSLLGAAVAALLVTVGPVLWYQATVASAYPFFILAIALLVTAGDAWVRRPTGRRLACFAAAIGLVLLAHKTGVFFAAGALAVLVLKRSELGRRSVLPLLAFLIPLATIVYIPLRDEWTGFPNLIGPHGSLLRWLTGTAENITEANTLGANRYAVAVHTGRFVVLTVASLSPAALVLVPAGLRTLWRDRVYMLCGLLPALLTSVVILTTPGAFAYRHVPLLMTGAIACGIGVEPVRAWLRARPRRGYAVTLLAVALLVAPASGIYYLQRSAREAGSWARGTLAVVPPGGSITAPWSAWAPLAAVQQLDGYRRDVHLVKAPEPWLGAAKLEPLRGTVAVGLFEVPQPVPGAVQVGPTAGLNIKGLSGLAVGPIRIGYPLIQARAYRMPPP